FAQDFHAHQQLEPDSRRRVSRESRRVGSRMASRLRRHGGIPVTSALLLSKEEFVQRIRTEGKDRYHDKHPFHVAMHAGKHSKAQIQAWVINRYYYQTRIPIKDAIILSKSQDPAFRRLWI